MILIADSGSTKTDWRLIDSENKIHQFSTQGFNPYFQSLEEISAEIKTKLVPICSINLGAPLTIFYYGAGCSSTNKKEIIKCALLQNFPQAIIEVEHDLLAAARAVCGKNKGIATILGTGSNTCYYDGEKIVQNIDSLGFILGDEGSGAHIGKTFMSAYLNKELPQELSLRFQERFSLSKEIILENIYKKPMPNRYLASFSQFIFQQQKEQVVFDLVADCFRQFFDKHICKYPMHKQVKISCVGSVAFYYSNVLRLVAEEKGLVIDRILESPIAGLLLYHTDNQD